MAAASIVVAKHTPSVKFWFVFPSTDKPSGYDAMLDPLSGLFNATFLSPVIY